MEEGVSVSYPTIKKRLKEADIIGKTARNKVGRVLAEAFFSESDVRKVCAAIFGLSQVYIEGYFANRELVRADIEAYAEALSKQEGEIKNPLDLSTYNIKSLSITPPNGQKIKGIPYILTAAKALGLAKNVIEGRSKKGHSLRKLKEIAGYTNSKSIDSSVSLTSPHPSDNLL